MQVSSKGAFMNINDRQCLPLTVCSCQQYQSRAPGAASDRQCSAMTLCDDDQYESRYPKKVWLNVLETKFVYTSDRECRWFTDYDTSGTLNPGTPQEVSHLPAGRGLGFGRIVTF